MAQKRMARQDNSSGLGSAGKKVTLYLGRSACSYKKKMRQTHGNNQTYPVRRSQTAPGWPYSEWLVSWLFLGSCGRKGGVTGHTGYDTRPGCQSITILLMFGAR